MTLFPFKLTRIRYWVLYPTYYWQKPSSELIVGYEKLHGYSNTDVRKIVTISLKYTRHKNLIGFKLS